MNTLIMACSAGKLDTVSTPMDMYRSRAWDLVRARARIAGFKVYVLSAEHGLINSEGCVIEPYDRKMDPARAREITRLGHGLMTSMPGRIHVFGGKAYRDIIKAWSDNQNIVEVTGLGRGCGDHYSALVKLLGPRLKRRFCPHTGVEHHVEIGARL